jgi:small-conductance mechanosensitive channel
MTLHDSLVRVAVTVGVAYESDIAAVRAALEEVAASHEGADPAYPPLVLLNDFAASSIAYEVSVWIHDPWALRRHRSMLREAIFVALRQKKIVIAYPQLDLHLDAPVTEALSRIGRAA